MFVLSPRRRRIIYVSLFEAGAIACSGPLLLALGGGEPANSWRVAIAVSVIAVVWNYLFNTMFEAWERRRPGRTRTLTVRCTHAALFEAGLVAATVPLYMVAYGVGPWQAFQMEVALLLFFFVYTVAFTWVFDRVFALPRSTRS